MKKLNESLSEVLDVEPITVEANEIVPIEEPKLPTTVDDDAEFARNNIRNLIQQGTTAVDGILNVAKESEHPRAYEVAATLIKSLSDLNKDLMEIQKRKRDLAPQDFSKNQNISVDKAVFVGSFTDLVKSIKNNKA